jgi:hypothetical protein
MSDKGQKNQLQQVLAFTADGTSEARKALPEGTESLTAESRTESPTRSTEQLMEEVCERRDCLLSLRRVNADLGLEATSKSC